MGKTTENELLVATPLMRFYSRKSVASSSSFFILPYFVFLSWVGFIKFAKSV